MISGYWTRGGHMGALSTARGSSLPPATTPAPPQVSPTRAVSLASPLRPVVVQGPLGLQFKTAAASYLNPAQAMAAQAEQAASAPVPATMRVFTAGSYVAHALSPAPAKTNAQEAEHGFASAAQPSSGAQPSVVAASALAGSAGNGTNTGLPGYDFSQYGNAPSSDDGSNAQAAASAAADDLSTDGSGDSTPPDMSMFQPPTLPTPPAATPAATTTSPVTYVAGGAAALAVLGFLAKAFFL